MLEDELLALTYTVPTSLRLRRSVKWDGQVSESKNEKIISFSDQSASND